MFIFFFSFSYTLFEFDIKVVLFRSVPFLFPGIDCVKLKLFLFQRFCIIHRQNYLTRDFSLSRFKTENKICLTVLWLLLLFYCGWIFIVHGIWRICLLWVDEYLCMQMFLGFPCMHGWSVVSTLCNPMDYSPPGSSVHKIFQARVLERAVTSSSGRSSQPRDWTQVSCAFCIAGVLITTKPPGMSYFLFQILIIVLYSFFLIKLILAAGDRSSFSLILLFFFFSGLKLASYLYFYSYLLSIFYHNHSF